MKAILSLAAAVLALSLGCSGSGDGSGARDAEFYYSLAVNYFYDQNSQQALRELTSCFAIDPDHVQAHNLAGLIYLGRKEYADALTHLRTAVEKAPGFLDARANLGAVLIEMQDWTGAIAELTPLARDPLYSTPYLVENNLGYAYFKLGKLQEAETHLKRAVFLNDNLCLGFNNLGMLHLEQGRAEDALDAFDAAIKRCPGYPEPYFHAGALLEESARVKEAAGRYEKCVKIGGESVFARRCQRKLQALR
jgi:Tfp pilus assembly protein PilF